MYDRRLQYVVAVARAGSFTKAAETAGITQPGITKSVADLERELGYSIFYRSARGVLVTEKGREFVERASRLLDDIRILLQGEGQEDPYAKVLRIGVCPASLEWVLPQPLAVLLRRHPKIIFDIVGASFERVVQLLRNGGVDIAVGFDDAFAEWSDIKRIPIAAVHAVLFVRKDHPILKRRAVSKSRFAKYDFVAPSDSRPYGSVIRELYESVGVAWQRRIHIIDSFPIVKRIVATSDAIAIATNEYANSPRFSATFRQVPGVSPFPPAAMCCAVRSRWELPPPVKALLRVLQATWPASSRDCE